MIRTTHGDSDMRSTIALIAITAALSAVPLVASADIAEGQKLVDENCTHCHGSEYYTRADRKIASLPKLRAQVQRCEGSLGLQWFDDQVDSVTEYLNASFYKF